MSEDGSPDLNDQAVARCREMGFDELAAFVEDCLEKPHGPDPGGDRPRTREEFGALWAMLREKHAALPDDPPPPPPPRSPLAKARDKRESTMGHLRRARGGESRANKRAIRTMEDTLDRLDREIERRLAAGETHGYGHARARTPEGPKRRRRDAMYRLLGKIERAFEPEPTGRLRWRPFEAQDPSPENIREHYEGHLRRQGKLDKFDQGRLKAATDLPYKEWWVPAEGFGGFDAYSILSFEHTGKVLLECPIWGNAAYVVDAGEEVWKDMTKRAMVESGLAEQIPHRGEDWPQKIRRALDLA